MGGRLLGGPTMVGTTSNWEDELVGWLKPFLDRLGHKARRRMCPLYVAGLIGPGDRKSIQPMAERLAQGDYDQLHHFVSAGVWDAAPLETELIIQADRLVGGGDRRYRGSEEGNALGRCRRAICFSTGQDRELPDTGVPDARPRRSADHGGVASFPSRQLDQRSEAVAASWCSSRISNCTDKARDRIGGDRSHDVGRRALPLCAGGCRLRAQCAVPSRFDRSQARLGCWHPPSPQGVPHWRAAHLADYQSSGPAP